MALRSILSALAVCTAGFASFAAAETFHIKDNQGFGRSMTAMTVELPAGWTAKGEVLWVKPCSGSDHYEIVFSAQSPDARTGMRYLPGHQILWLEAVPTGFPPDLAQMLIANVEADRNRIATQFRDSNCHVARVTGTDQLLRALVLNKRPRDMQLLESKPWEQGLGGYKTTFAPAAAAGLNVVYDARDISISYRSPAGPVEESLLFSWYMFQSAPPAGIPGTFTQNAVVDTIRVAWRAPERRDADAATLSAIAQSIKADPAWQKEVAAYFDRLRQQRQAAARASAGSGASTGDSEADKLRGVIDDFKDDLQRWNFLDMIWQ